MSDRSKDTERDTVELRDEQLRVDKQPVETGEARVGKRVVTDTKRVDVPVMREEAVIERRPVEPRAASGPVDDDGEISVPLREEQVRVDKEPVVREEVRVGKRPVQQTQRVEEEVAHEEPVMEGVDEQ